MGTTRTKVIHYGLGIRQPLFVMSCKKFPDIKKKSIRQRKTERVLDREGGREGGRMEGGKKGGRMEGGREGGREGKESERKKAVIDL